MFNIPFCKVISLDSLLKPWNPSTYPCDFPITDKE